MKSTVKFGDGSVMVWGMMSAAGVELIVRVQGTLNADFYKILLIQYAVPNLQYLCKTTLLATKQGV